MLKKVLWWLFRKTGLGFAVLKVHPKSALNQLGWYRSFHEHRPVDRSGIPVAWWTYPALHFLDGTLNDTLRVLEFGCGNSTIWLSRRVKEVVSIEDNHEWAQRIGQQLPVNARLIFTESLEFWPARCGRENGLFDVIVIDAGNRIECARNARQLLSDVGVFVWDNTDGPDWPAIRAMLVEQGFRDISFRGMVPQEICLSTTTVFYRRANCLGI